MLKRKTKNGDDLKIGVMANRLLTQFICIEIHKKNPKTHLQRSKQEEQHQRELTGIGASNHGSASKITAIRKRILLVIVIERVRSMVSNRIRIVAISTGLNRRAIGASHAARIVQS